MVIPEPTLIIDVEVEMKILLGLLIPFWLGTVVIRHVVIGATYHRKYSDSDCASMMTTYVCQMTGRAEPHLPR